MAIPLVILVLIVVSLHWNNTFADWTMLTLCWHFMSPMSSRSIRQNESSRGRVPYEIQPRTNCFRLNSKLNPYQFYFIYFHTNWEPDGYRLIFDWNKQYFQNLRNNGPFGRILNGTLSFEHLLWPQNCSVAPLGTEKHILINNSHQMLKTVTYGSIDGWVEKCHSQWPEILFHKDCATKSTENLKWKNKTGHKYAMFCNNWAWIRSTRQKCRPINALLKFSNRYYL